MSNNIDLCVVAVDIRSTHNVGAILRTADGFSAKVILTGITPYPASEIDERLPHIASKTNRAIAKTALGAEKSVSWRYTADTSTALNQLREKGYRILALEQTPSSQELSSYRHDGAIALVLGPEVTGLPQEILMLCDEAIEIPMSGKKESFNVSVAAGIALYHLRFQV